MCFFLIIDITVLHIKDQGILIGRYPTGEGAKKFRTTITLAKTCFSMGTTPASSAVYADCKAYSR